MSKLTSETERVADHNRRAWDKLVAGRQRFTRPAKPQDLENPLATVDPKGWLSGDVQGKKLLCLASGGGRQSVMYAKAGAEVTVVDVSTAMLDQDRQAARQLGLEVDTVAASMHDLSALTPASFDIVIHPVSTCYMPQVTEVYEQIAKVMKIGGLYISQHKQPTSMQVGIKPTPFGYAFEHTYYRTTALPPAGKTLLREPGTLEFIHRWQDLIGGMCRAGFVIEDLTEPKHTKPKAAHGSFEDRSRFVAPYVRIKARRAETTQPIQARVWAPSAD